MLNARTHGAEKVTGLDTSALDTHLLNLRKKVQAVPAKPRYLCSVRGMGYRFDG